MKMISQLVHQGQPLDTSQILEFMKVKKERSVSAALEHLLKNMKSKEIPSEVWLFVQDRQNDALEQGEEELRIPVTCCWIKQKSDANVACLVYPVSESTHNA